MAKKLEIDHKPDNVKVVGHSAREERLAQSLRANLQKRKDQVRQRLNKNELAKDDLAPE